MKNLISLFVLIFSVNAFSSTSYLARICDGQVRKRTNMVKKSAVLITFCPCKSSRQLGWSASEISFEGEEMVVGIDLLNKKGQAVSVISGIDYHEGSETRVFFDKKFEKQCQELESSRN